MKTLILPILCILIFIIFWKNEPSVTPKKNDSTQIIQTQTPKSNPGWKEIGVEDGYTMYQPSTDTTTTEWFCIEDWNSTYALRDCIMQFKKKQSGEIISFKYNSSKIECFLETFPGSGIFANEKWTGYDENIMKTSHVRFVKTTDPFNVTVGVKKLSP